MALFVRDDERVTVRWMSVKNALAHPLAGKFHSLIPYRFQIVKLDTYPIAHCHGIVSDVKEVATERWPLSDV